MPEEVKLAIWIFVGVLVLVAVQAIVFSAILQGLRDKGRLDGRKLFHRFLVAWGRWAGRLFVVYFLFVGVAVFFVFFGQAWGPILEERDNYLPGRLEVVSVNVPTMNSRGHDGGDTCVRGVLYSSSNEQLAEGVRLRRILVDPDKTEQGFFPKEISEEALHRAFPRGAMLDIQYHPKAVVRYTTRSATGLDGRVPTVLPGGDTTFALLEKMHGRYTGVTKPLLIALLIAVVLLPCGMAALVDHKKVDRWLQEMDQQRAAEEGAQVSSSEHSSSA